MAIVPKCLLNSPRSWIKNVKTGFRWFGSGRSGVFSFSIKFGNSRKSAWPQSTTPTFPHVASLLAKSSLLIISNPGYEIWKFLFIIAQGKCQGRQDFSNMGVDMTMLFEFDSTIIFTYWHLYRLTFILWKVSIIRSMMLAERNSAISFFKIQVLSDSRLWLNVRCFCFCYMQAYQRVILNGNRTSTQLRNNPKYFLS